MKINLIYKGLGAGGQFLSQGFGVSNFPVRPPSLRMNYRCEFYESLLKRQRHIYQASNCPRLGFCILVRIIYFVKCGGIVCRRR